MWGNYSGIVGSQNTITASSGNSSDNVFVAGYLNKVINAKHAAALGWRLEMTGVDGQVGVGKYNDKATQAQFFVGTGTNNTTERRNSFEVYDKLVKVLGSLEVTQTAKFADPIENEDAVNKKYVDMAIGDIETVLDEIIELQNGLIGGDTV